MLSEQCTSKKETVLQVYINGRFLTQPVTGVQRYALEVVRALDSFLDTAEGPEFVLLHPSNVKSSLNLRNIRQKQLHCLQGQLWEQITLPLFTLGRPLLNLCGLAPLLKKNQVVTIHDAAVSAMPKSFSWRFRTWYRMAMPIIGKFARGVITISHFSKNELQKYYSIPEHKLSVIYEGKEQVFAAMADLSVLDRNGLNDRPFILAVSSMNPGKNFAGLANAVDLIKNPPFDVVIAGGTNARIFRQTAASFGGEIKCIGYVTDGELRALYEHAACFIYPSLYEGFGLPPLEAMACGCPVIVSNAASLPELYQDAAIFCDPSSPQDMADKILAVIGDSRLQQELAQKGLERAALFTWSKCAEEIFKTIEKFIFVR